MSEQATELSEIELFIKASFDKERKGGCPMCHQWFMAFYCMAERGYFNLTVTTIALESPPASFTKLNTSGRIPAVLFKSGVVNNSNLESQVYSTYDEIEGFMKLFQCAEFQTAKESRGIKEAEAPFLDLYTKFNVMLKSDNQAPLNKVLKKIDTWLGNEWAEQERDNGEHYKFLLSNDLTYADVQLFPKLQHVRVAGKFFNNFEIDHSLKNLWTYLGNMYKLEMYDKTCPSDQSIIKFYQDKARDGVKKTLKVNFQAESYMNAVPDDVFADSSSQEPNGGSEVQDTEMPPAQEQVPVQEPAAASEEPPAPEEVPAPEEPKPEPIVEDAQPSVEQTTEQAVENAASEEQVTTPDTKEAKPDGVTDTPMEQQLID